MDEYALLEAVSNSINNYCFELLSSKVLQVHFVQVGAHDGRTDDPIFEFIKKHNWAGVRVEPVPATFERLKQNSSELKYVQLMQVLCARDTTPRPFYTVAPGDDGYYSFLSSFDKGVIMAHASLVPNLAERIQENTIETLTVQTVIERSGLPGIDLLCVDAEGFDDEVILSLNYAKHVPKLIYFEHKHLREFAFRNLDYILKDIGYTPIRLYTDSFYVSREFLKEGKLAQMARGCREMFSF